MGKWEELIVTNEHNYDINRRTIRKYARKVKIGQKLKVTDDRMAVVKKKYPHIVLTDKGSFIWSDIYFINELGHRLQTFGYDFFRVKGE